MIEARKVRQDEIEAYLRIGGYSYGNWSDEVETWTPEPDQLNNLLGVYVDGKMVARLANHSYEQMVRGVWHPASAIGGVATWPEDRRQGYVRQLFDATFADMQTKGQVVSTLHPFSQSFYAKFGYVQTNPIPRVRLQCSSLSHLLPLANQAGDGWRYERASAVDAVAPYKQFVYQIAQQRGNADYNGYMRNPNFDADNCRNQQIIFVKEKSTDGSEQLLAAARYTPKGYGSDGTNTIHDCHWIDVSARARLLAFFALHGAGMPNIQIHTPPHTNFHSWLSDSDNAYEVHMSHLPLMVRVMDVVRALSGIRTGHAISNLSNILFEVQDSICPWVGGTFEVSGSAGALTAQRVNQPSTITLTIEGITALIYGTLSLDEIEHRGWICGVDDEQRALLNGWFPERPIFSLLGF